MTATWVSTNQTAAGRMRPLNMMRDLPAVADLIELCFSSTLDAEGRSYIDQMRRNGRDSSFLSWAPRVIDTVSLPLSGFVWEINGRVIGNVSLIPFVKRGQKIFLIANVATHPEFRRQGIARQLTAAAMARAKEKNARSIWLHVRDDNPGAIRLYHELGFVERSRRTTWYSSAGTTPLGDLRGSIQISPRPAREWALQEAWLSRAYPANLDWYNSQNWSVFKPGILNTFYRLFADLNVYQWSAYQNTRLMGILACQRSGGYSGQIWAAMPEQADPRALTALLLHGRRMLSQTHGLSMEYPAGPMDEAIHTAGFRPQRTLAWMEAPGVATL